MAGPLTALLNHLSKWVCERRLCMLCCSLPAWVADTNGARCWQTHSAGLERRKGRWVVSSIMVRSASAATLKSPSHSPSLAMSRFIADPRWHRRPAIGIDGWMDGWMGGTCGSALQGSLCALHDGAAIAHIFPRPGFLCAVHGSGL